MNSEKERGAEKRCGGSYRAIKRAESAKVGYILKYSKEHESDKERHTNNSTTLAFSLSRLLLLVALTRDPQRLK